MVPKDKGKCIGDFVCVFANRLRIDVCVVSDVRGIVPEKLGEIRR